MAVKDASVDLHENKISWKSINSFLAVGNYSSMFLLVQQANGKIKLILSGV